MFSYIVFIVDSKIVFVILQDFNEVMVIDLFMQNVMWCMIIGFVLVGVWVMIDQKYLLVGMIGVDYVEVIDWYNCISVKCILIGKGVYNFCVLGDKCYLFLLNCVLGMISIIDQ